MKTHLSLVFNIDKIWALGGWLRTFLPQLSDFVSFKRWYK